MSFLPKLRRRQVNLPEGWPKPKRQFAKSGVKDVSPWHLILMALGSEAYNFNVIVMIIKKGYWLGLPVCIIGGIVILLYTFKLVFPNNAGDKGSSTQVELTPKS